MMRFSCQSFDTGLSVDGLYRVSGNLAVIQKLRFAVNHGKTRLKNELLYMLQLYLSYGHIHACRIYCS